MSLLILIVLVLLVCGGGGYYFYGRGTAAPGYAPGGIIGVLLLVFVVWLLVTHIGV